MRRDLHSPGPALSDASPSELASSQGGKSADHQECPVPRKDVQIVGACQEKDLDALIGFSRSDGGFLRDDLRRRAWPLLIGSEVGPRSEKDATCPESLQPATAPHSDEDQVHLDVSRAFVYYPSGLSDKEIDGRKIALSDLIVQTLRAHPVLSYFQGYHDIVQVFLLVLGKELATAAVARVSLLRIRDYMLPSLSPSLRHLQIIPALLESVDRILWQRLSTTQPFFALAATLTLYAHDIQEYSDIARLYDFLLAHEPVMAIYLFTAIIISRRKELLEIPPDEPEMLHFTLSKLPHPLDLESLISHSMQLFRVHPPESLPRLTWWKISSHSVLKSLRDVRRQQTIEAGEELFTKQLAELRREEVRKEVIKAFWKHRRKAMPVVLALMTGIFSLWLARNGHEKDVWLYVKKATGIFGLLAR